MTVKKILSKDDIRLKINMKDILGRNLPNDSDVIDAIGQKAIDMIIERTQDGKALNGRNFTPKYSDEYKASDEFKAFGKTNKVNMTLTGDMLGLMDVVKSTRNTFDIGWDDAEENAKAFNHNTGDTVHKRPFFGLQKQEIKQLKKFAERLIKDKDDE